MKRNLEGRLAKLETRDKPGGGLLVVHHYEDDPPQLFARHLEARRRSLPHPPELVVIIHSLGGCPRPKEDPLLAD